MSDERRTAVYDEALHLEAYRFEWLAQPFPNHFHEYYVIGLMEKGERTLSCKGQEYHLRPGDLLLFNPGDSHACTQCGGTLDYRALNIPKETMRMLAEEVTGRRELPGFSVPVVQNEDAACCLRTLHELVMSQSADFGKEELLLLLLSDLIEQYGQPFSLCIPECPDEVEAACTYMEAHFAEHICLEQLCRHVGLSRSTLLRTFTRTKGVTPYCYLENIRIGRARLLLEQGVPPIEAALRTGFSDQSHFTKAFSRFIGLAPGVYREIFTASKKEHI